MTKAKAMTVVSALINADYSPTISVIGNDYTISVTSADGVSINTLKTFADSQNINATIRTVDFK